MKSLSAVNLKNELLETLQQIKMLTDLVAEVELGKSMYGRAMVVFAEERDKLLAEVALLRAALAPFVDSYNRDAEPIGDSDLYGEQPRSVHVTLGDCRKAARIAAMGLRDDQEHGGGHE
jgi:hypothetical protein